MVLGSEMINLPAANAFSAQHNQLPAQAGASAAVEICFRCSCWLQMQPQREESKMLSVLFLPNSSARGILALDTRLEQCMVAWGRLHPGIIAHAGKARSQW